MASKTKQRLMIALGVTLTIATLSVTAIYLPMQGVEKSKSKDFQAQRQQLLQQQNNFQRNSMWKTMDQHIKQQEDGIEDTAVTIAFCGSPCEYTVKDGATNWVSKQETVHDASVCTGTVSYTGIIDVYANATSDCRIFVCKNSMKLLILSSIWEVKAGVPATFSHNMGGTSAFHDLNVCLEGNDKVYFEQLSMNFRPFCC